MAYLALVRHGESAWNAKGVWTGWQDPPLSQKGHEEARKAGGLLKNLSFDFVFVSSLLRSLETFDEIAKVNGITLSPIITNDIRERNYGVYTGKNKWEIEKELGAEDFKKLRRNWDFPIQDGESLKQVYERVIPYYEREILPKIKEGKNVLISAHGNSLRALTKYLENISDDGIANLEIETGQVIVYQLDKNGKITSKEIRGKKV